MFVYVLKRLAVGAVTLLVASIVVFVSVLASSGDPRDRLATCVGCDQSAYDDEVASFRLDEPLPVQYTDWVGRLLTGNLEPASSQGDGSVVQLTATRVSNTMWLVVPAWLLATSLTLYLAVKTASKHGRFSRFAPKILGVWGLVIPAFLTGLLLQTVVVLVSDRWGFKPFRSQGLEANTFLAFLSSSALPVTTLVLMLMSRRYAVLRAAVESAMNEPFIEAAVARGVPRFRIMFFHLPRLIAAPFLAGTLSEVSLLVGGTVVVETVFAWPGAGQLLASSLRSSDIELSLFLAIVPVVVLLLCGILVDVLQAIIDPRVREARR